MSETATVDLTLRLPLTARLGLFAREEGPHDPFTLARPGTLPLVDQCAVDRAIRVALIVGAEIAAVSRWTRRHRFDPALARGYQITQVEVPLARGGVISDRGRGWTLTQLHISEAPGGAPQVELLVAPFTGLAAAAECARALAAILTADALEDPAQLRCDMTITLADGTRRTVGDLDLAALERATCGDRASDLPETSENADEYYLPEPDLPPLHIDAARLARVRRELGGAAHA
jgi:Asp-tRNA(Asn)/Glu-tRNA(Gln) amidotransferase B subunit